MRKLSQHFEDWLVRFTDFVEGRRPLLAIRETLGVLFPFALIATYLDLLATAVFSRNGFFNHIYYISHWWPQFKQFGNFFTETGSTISGLIAVIAAYACANYLAREYQRDNLLAGITSALCFLILNYNYAAANSRGTDQAATQSRFLESNLNAQGIFLALVVGLLVGWTFSKLSHHVHTHRQVETTNRLIERARVNWLPISVSVVIAGLISFGISLFAKNGLNGLIYAVFQLPFTSLGHVLLLIIGLTFLNNIFWLIGIIGPVDFMNNDSMSTLQNLQYALQHGSPWGAPNPITAHTVFDAYANFGGNGMTLALIIAILWQSKNHGFRTVAKSSFLPGLVNLNQPLLFGIPIMFNPVLAIPFLIAPIVCILISWVFLTLHWMPPVVYPYARTTPGFLIGWLGTGGDWRALLVSLLNLAVSVGIYLPFIRLNNRVIARRQATKGEGV